MTGQQIRCARERLKVTRPQMEILLGVTQGYYCAIENDDIIVAPRLANHILDILSFGREQKLILAINKDYVLVE